MFSIGNEELNKCEKLGKEIICPHCKEKHKVKYGANFKFRESGEKGKIIAFYDCGEKAYICGIDGRNIMVHLADQPP